MLLKCVTLVTAALSALQVQAAISREDFVKGIHDVSSREHDAFTAVFQVTAESGQSVGPGIVAKINAVTSLTDIYVQTLHVDPPKWSDDDQFQANTAWNTLTLQEVSLFDELVSKRQDLSASKVAIKKSLQQLEGINNSMFSILNRVLPSRKNALPAEKALLEKNTQKALKAYK
ncbi:hypothetical protein PT974_12092 [Cladobotryum mycophilum]|uniref:Uncharacterized protein n=1 Tax=Cladobotryum mycophilum TaxID=491253 RepID=A0ABR0S726_9HYPO